MENSTKTLEFKIKEKRYKLLWYYKDYKKNPRKYTILESDDIHEIYAKSEIHLKNDPLKLKQFCFTDNKNGVGLVNIRDHSHKWYQDGILKKSNLY